MEELFGPDKSLKILVVGDSGVGKTSFIKRFVYGSFSGSYKQTVGLDFVVKTLPIGDETITLQLWDIAGQERFRSMTRVYYKDALGALVLADITEPSTLEGACKWKQDIDNKVRLGGDYEDGGSTNNAQGELLPSILLANKSDLKRDQSEGIPEREMMRVFEQEGFVGWEETSAKDGTNVERSILYLVEKIVEKQSALLASEENKWDKKDSKRKSQQKKAFTLGGGNNSIRSDRYKLGEDNEKKNKCCTT